MIGLSIVRGRARELAELACQKGALLRCGAAAAAAATARAGSGIGHVSILGTMQAEAETEISKG